MDHRLTVLVWSTSLAIAVTFLFWKLAQMGAKRQRDNGFNCEIGRFPLLFSGGALVTVILCALRLPAGEAYLFAVAIPALAISATTDSRALALFEFVNYPLVVILAGISVYAKFTRPSAIGVAVGLCIAGLAYAAGRFVYRRDGVGLGDFPLVASVGIATGPVGVALITTFGSALSVFFRRGGETPMAPGLFVALLLFALTNAYGIDLLTMTAEYL
jgi:prepilin signal peptidase PulO-like enzyme (type II secretory pathway)